MVQQVLVKQKSKLIYGPLEIEQNSVEVTHIIGWLFRNKNCTTEECHQIAEKTSTITV